MPNDAGKPQRDQSAKTVPEKVPTTQAASPSFDCGNASAPDEQAICSDDGLAGLDIQTTNEWRQLRGTDKDSATRIAREFLTARKTCGMDKGCIRKSQEQALASFRSAGAPASSSGLRTVFPSFDCRKANAADELAICSDDRLSELDRQTTAAWRRRRDTDKESATQMAREFLRVRQACGSDKSCIRNSQEQALAKYRMP